MHQSPEIEEEVIEKEKYLFQDLQSSCMTVRSFVQTDLQYSGFSWTPDQIIEPLVLSEQSFIDQ